ncbi:DUF2058 family protein [Halorhodospira halophila]|uniref:Uncharacterized protein n=1 Tax=Halorhodospira halophila (strain DSM 244 / SL1) TaxID=349124 RepID=A1WY35_HALHL|nr:DUF2058 family protein [Halorhodospira halophila]ABM62597.1 conserved hypothetical protein [Halorhodospira halophila SL1]
MKNSLQEQLVRAGLASQEKVRNQRSGSRPESRRRPRRDRAPRRAKGASAQTPLEARIPLPDLIHHYALPRWGADTAYHFTEGQRIRHVWVTRQQQRQLADGYAGLVTADDGLRVVPRAVAEQVRQRRPAALLVLHPLKERDDAPARRS